MANSALRLLATRRLGPLCVTEACGAFNNNLVRNGVIVLVLFKVGEGGIGFTALATALLIVPQMLFSATAGQVADRFSKQRVILVAKAAEAVLMALAALAFVIGSETILLAVLLGVGAKAAMLDPAKYGLLPEQLAEDELVAGNGALEATSFLFILLGTIVGGWGILLDYGGQLLAVAAIASAGIGLLAAARIPMSSLCDPSLRIRLNIPLETWRLVRQAVRLRTVWLSILGLSWFWTVGAVLLTEFPTITRDTLAADGQVATLFLTVFAVGVGLGSIFCARLLKGTTSPSHVPLAALGISIFCWDFGSSALTAGHFGNIGAVVSSVQGWRILIDLFLLSLCGGLFSVPLYVLVQHHSPKNSRGRIIGANSVVNAAFMVVGSGVAFGLDAAAVSPPRVVQILAIANLCVAFCTFRLFPENVFRAIFKAYFESKTRQ